MPSTPRPSPRATNSRDLAEIDEVERHRVAGPELLEVGQQRLDDVELDAPEEGRRASRPPALSLA